MGGQLRDQIVQLPPPPGVHRHREVYPEILVQIRPDLRAIALQDAAEEGYSPGVPAVFSKCWKARLMIFNRVRIVGLAVAKAW